MDGEPQEVTRLLHAWRDGSPEAFTPLISLTYPQLRMLARAFVRNEQNPHIQATELVHELFLRLQNRRTADWNDRAHFYNFAAKLMRMVLIDKARRNRASKRGGQANRVPLDEELAWVDAESPAVLELDLALEELEKVDPQKVRIVELRFFLGFTAEEAAEALGISKATLDRDMKVIKAWLYRRLEGNRA